MKKLVIILFTLLLVGCQQKEAVQQEPTNSEETSEAVLSEQNVEQQKASPIQQYKDAIANMSTWESVRASYSFLEIFSDDLQLNRELMEDYYYVASPLQVYDYAHYMSFQNDHHERYYTEETGLLTRSQFNDWTEASSDTIDFKNPAQQFAPFFEMLVDKGINFDLQDDFVTFMMAPDDYIAVYQQFYQSFFNLQLTAQEIIEELGEMIAIDVTLKLEQGQLASYYVVIRSSVEGQPFDERILNGEFLERNTLERIPTLDEL